MSLSPHADLLKQALLELWVRVQPGYDGTTAKTPPPNEAMAVFDFVEEGEYLHLCLARDDALSRDPKDPFNQMVNKLGTRFALAPLFQKEKVSFRYHISTGFMAHICDEIRKIDSASYDATRRHALRKRYIKPFKPT